MTSLPAGPATSADIFLWRWNTCTHYYPTPSARSRPDSCYRSKDSWVTGTIDENDNPIKKSNSVWLEVQKFYVFRARLVLATAAVASSKAYGVLRPRFTVIDEASQMREIEVVGAVARHLRPGILQNIIMLGDKNSYRHMFNRCCLSSTYPQPCLC